MRSTAIMQQGGGVMVTTRRRANLRGPTSLADGRMLLTPRQATKVWLCLLGLLALPWWLIDPSQAQTPAAQTPAAQALVGPQTPTPPPAQMPLPPPASTNPSLPPPSRCDAGCVRANADRALLACAPRIEAESATDFDWILRPVPGIFQQADQASATDAVVRYRGDSLRFQTIGKEWVRVSYECGYNVETKTVAFVSIRPGRLDRPIVATAPQPQRPAPHGSARVPADGAPMRAMVSRGSTGNAPTPGEFAAAQPAGPVPQSVTLKASKAAPVGEPSPIQILQQVPRVR